MCRSSEVKMETKERKPTNPSTLKHCALGVHTPTWLPLQAGIFPEQWTWVKTALYTVLCSSASDIYVRMCKVEQLGEHPMSFERVSFETLVASQETFISSQTMCWSYSYISNMITVIVSDCISSDLYVCVVAAHAMHKVHAAGAVWLLNIVAKCTCVCPNTYKHQPFWHSPLALTIQQSLGRGWCCWQRSCKGEGGRHELTQWWSPTLRAHAAEDDIISHIYLNEIN